MSKKYWVTFTCMFLVACSSGTPPDPVEAPVVNYVATDLSGELTAENTVTLSWAAANYSKARYEVLRTSQSQDDCPIELKPEGCTDYKLLETRETTIQDTDVPWGGKYYYFLRVGSTDHNVVSKYSPVAEVTVPVIAPRSVQLTMSGTTASLKWDHLPNVGYSILISNENGCDPVSISACAGGVEIEEKGAESLQRLLDVGKDYYFWVKAKNNGYSDITDEPIHKFVDPFSPSDILIKQSGRDLSIEWDEDRNTSYSVLRWESCGEALSLTAEADSESSAEKLCGAAKIYGEITDKPPYVDTSVTPGTVYYYALQASAGGKTAKRSSLVKGVLNAPVPTDFSVDIKGNASVISFTRDSEFPAIRYDFYRTADLDCKVQDSFSGCSDRGSSTNITTGYVDGKLKGNREYGYWLEASIGEAKSISVMKVVSTGSVLLDVNADRSFILVNDSKCVLESESGLRWANLSIIDGTVGGSILDADDRFEFDTVENTGKSSNMCGEGSQAGSSCSTSDVIKRFNAAKVCGKDNWRLPSLTELMSVVNYQDANIGKTSFYKALKPSESTFKYWTSEAKSDGSMVVAVDELDGTFSYHNQSELLKVRLVSPGVKDE